MRSSDPLTRHFRLSPLQEKALHKLGIWTVRDLLYHFPDRYERAGAESRSDALVPGAKVTLYGSLTKLESTKLWKSRRPATEGWFSDTAGRVKVMWFNQPYIAKMVPTDTPVRLTGTVGGTTERPYIANPEVEPVPAGFVPPSSLFANDASEGTAGLFPVYPESQGITSRWFFHALERVLSSGAHESLSDPIPEDTRAALHLPTLSIALVWVHAPREESHAQTARKRFAFEEILALQVARARERARNDAQGAFRLNDAPARAAEFLATLPFPATDAQMRAVREIATDLCGTHPMARLLEGDVGAGKTAVAAASAYAVVTSRGTDPVPRLSASVPRSSVWHQVAYMAPTEILASQHFASFVGYFSHLPISIGLITGSTCMKYPSKTRAGAPTKISRAQLLKWVASGEIALLIGTHALIQKGVRFKHLALAIVDEQHRFGTRQRAALAHQGDAAPHFLSMTATPIPRTLALTIYGDLDLSVLDELPAGRAKVVTSIVTKDTRTHMYEALRRELTAGRQAYVICPRIEEPDPAKENALQAKSAKAEARRLQQDIFPEFRVGLLHGAMTPAEKNTAMRAFERNETQVLVATSVVEVGVNVPNATSIVIEGAERFGLSQLHQLRGRVQRSSHQPYCYLVPDTNGAIAMKRLRVLEKSSDGFALAEADLANRGTGDLSGRRQWGVSDIGMEALRNPRLIEAARAAAAHIIADDPELTRHPTLAARLAESEVHGE